jgi:hypothetical protein
MTAFEPVIMVCNPGEANEVRDRCGAAVEAHLANGAVVMPVWGKR